MPIKPENRARYPKNWKEIRQRILCRANYRCEHPDCGAMHRELGYWNDGVWVSLPPALKDAGVDKPCSIQCADGSTIKVIMIVLTIAHLDHTPENCSDDNLRAWCQRHHLAYDHDHHQQNSRKTRRNRLATGDLFEVKCPKCTTGGGPCYCPGSIYSPHPDEMDIPAFLRKHPN